jgi:hypothetical protein
MTPRRRKIEPGKNNGQRGSSAPPDKWVAGVPKAPSPLRFAGALHGQEVERTVQTDFQWWQIRRTRLRPGTGALHWHAIEQTFGGFFCRQPPLISRIMCENRRIPQSLKLGLGRRGQQQNYKT